VLVELRYNLICRYIARSLAMQHPHSVYDAVNLQAQTTNSINSFASSIREQLIVQSNLNDTLVGVARTDEEKD
jgi:hypothetical protein